MVTLVSAPVVAQGDDPSDHRQCRSRVADDVAGTTRTWSINVDGQRRSFNVHFPLGFERDEPNDLVIIFHGYGDSAQQFELTTGLSETADREGFIVVYPDALATDFVGAPDPIATWNDLSTSGSPGPAGTACDPTNPFLSPVAVSCAADPHRDTCNWSDCATDDVGFAEAMLERLERRLCLQRDRIFIAGLSNGAMMAHRIVCQIPDRFAAAALVIGRPFIGYNCAPLGTKLPLMQIWGTQDEIVPGTGEQSVDGYHYVSVPDLEERWAGVASQSCDDGASPHDPGVTNLSIACTQRDNCHTGAEVVQCALEMDHQWPSSDPDDPSVAMSPPEAGDRFMNDVIWDFFDRNGQE
jgi:polyhydroxybutyrate depolymerase